MLCRQALTNWDYFSELSGRSGDHYRVPILKMGVYDRGTKHRKTKDILIVTGPVRGIVLDELKLGALTAITSGYDYPEKNVRMTFFKGVVVGIVDIVSTLHDLGHVHRTVHPGRFAIEALSKKDRSVYELENEDQFAKYYNDKLSSRVDMLLTGMSARGGRASVAPVRFDFSCGFSRKCLFSTSETDVYRTPQEW